MKETETKQKKPLKLGVFIPSFVITGGAAPWAGKQRVADIGNLHRF